MKKLISLMVLLLPWLAFAANGKREDPIERAVVAGGMVILLFIIGSIYAFIKNRKGTRGSMKIYVVIIALVITVLLAVYVWPTQYKYERWSNGNLLVRIDRFTGEAEVLYRDGWEKMRPAINWSDYTPVK